MSRILIALVFTLGCAQTDDLPFFDAMPIVDATVDTKQPVDIPPVGDQTIPDNWKMWAHSKNQLFSILPNTLELTLVGEFKLIGEAGTEAPDINDLAVTPDNKVYALSQTALYQVDIKTAEISKLTDVETSSSNVALTFEVTGTLLAADKDGNLRRIDPKTGQITEIGSYGEGFGAGGDLVGVANGTVYGVNDAGEKKWNNYLVTVDPNTGKATEIGAIGFHHVWGLCYWRGTIYGLTRGNSDPDPTKNEPGQLIAIDPELGNGTLIASYPYEFWGGAVIPLAPLK